MKKYFVNICILAAAISVTGCKKFLEQVPDQRTELNSPEKVSELLVNAYPNGNYMTFCESMSDNVTDNFGAATVELTNTLPYLYQDGAEVNQDSPDYYWDGAYKAIAAANQALEAISKAPNPEAYRAQKGEALVCRAYAHFMLVTLFSKVYDPATAATDPGVPYVTSPETIVFGKYDRKTVAYVYEQIEKDLTEGLPLINNNAYTVPKFHFTKIAAHAFATRFYLFKKDMQKSVDHAKLAFPADNFVANMRPWLTLYQVYTSTETGLNYVKSTEPANLLLCETTSWWARRFTSHRYSTSENLMNRIIYKGYANVANGTTAYRSFSATAAAVKVYYIRKLSEHFVRTSLNATSGRGYVMIPLFTTEEVLLNRAEAYASMDMYTEALKDLNTFVSTRITGYNPATHTITEAKAKTFYATDNSRDAIIKAILDFKRAEYIHEGMRWFDILRHKIEVKHDRVDAPSIVLTANDPRRVLQIPQEASLTLGTNPR